MANPVMANFQTEFGGAHLWTKDPGIILSRYVEHKTRIKALYRDKPVFESLRGLTQEHIKWELFNKKTPKTILATSHEEWTPSMLVFGYPIRYEQDKDSRFENLSLFMNTDHVIEILSGVHAESFILDVSSPELFEDFMKRYESSVKSNHRQFRPLKLHIKLEKPQEPEEEADGSVLSRSYLHWREVFERAEEAACSTKFGSIIWSKNDSIVDQHSVGDFGGFIQESLHFKNVTVLQQDLPLHLLYPPHWKPIVQEHRHWLLLWLGQGAHLQKARIETEKLAQQKRVAEEDLVDEVNEAPCEDEADVEKDTPQRKRARLEEAPATEESAPAEDTAPINP